MSWTTPKTWVSGNTLTAAELNTHVRDNFNAAIPVTTTITTTGTQTALAIPDGRGDLVIFANNASTLTLQGISAAQNGQTLSIVSIGAGNVVIENQSGSASAANRIITKSSDTITLAAGFGYTVLTYDGTNSRWRMGTFDQGVLSYTPSPTGFSLGNGTLTGSYVRSGDQVNWSITLVIGSTTSFSSAIEISLPVTTSNGVIVGAGIVVDVGSGNYTCLAYSSGSGTRATFYSCDGLRTGAFTSAEPMTWATGDSLTVSGTYFAA
jgi:hypothetical protein